MKQRSRTEYSLLNMLTGVVGYSINTVVGFICRIIFVRVLGKDYLGVSGLFTNILSVLSLAELGMASAIVYALYKPIAENNEKKIASIMQYYRKAYTAIGCSVAALGLATMPFLDMIITDAPKIEENLYLLYLLYLAGTVASYFFSYRQSLFAAAQRQYVISGYSYVQTIGQSILQIIYLLFTHDYIGYLLIQILSGVLYNITISLKAGKDYPYIKERQADPLSAVEKKSLFTNIRALAINQVSGVFVNSTDNIAITYFSGLSSVGYASNYSLLSTTLNGVIGLVFNALPGSVGNLNATTDGESRYRFFKVLNLTNFWLFGWGAIGIAFVSGDLVKLMYGAQYVLPSYIPLILAVNFFTIGMLQACYVYKSTLGLFRYGQHLLFFTGIINLALDVVLGRIWGIFGIFLATLIARLCTNLWYEPYAVYRYGFQKSPWLYAKRYARFWGILLLAGGICWRLCNLCHFAASVNVLLKIIICSLVPNGLFLLFFRNTEELSYLKGSARRIVDKISKRDLLKRM